MVPDVALFGLWGFSHGASRLITVMSPSGIAAVTDIVTFDPGEIRAELHPGVLPQYHEKVRGGVSRLVERHGITVLDFNAWTEKKARFGTSIYC